MFQIYAKKASNKLHTLARVSHYMSTDKKTFNYESFYRVTIWLLSPGLNVL